MGEEKSENSVIGSDSANSKKSARAPKTPLKEGGEAKNFLKTAFAGRGNEMLGLGLVLGGLLAGLSIYLEQAGPVGDVVDGAAGWTIGIIKLVLPVLMVITGLAMFRERSEFGEITKRLPVGLFLGLVGVSGLLHLSRGRPGISDGVDELGDAGGILGLAAGGGSRAAIGTWGSVLVLVAFILVSVVVATRVSARDAIRITVKSAGIAGKQMFKGIALLLTVLSRSLGNWIRSLLTPPGSTEQREIPDRVREEDTFQENPPTEAEITTVDEPQKESKPKKKKPKSKVKNTGSEQLTIQLGKAVEGSSWSLPSLDILSTSDTHDVDAKAAEERGKRLQEALEAHGVETRLVDMTIGPTVTRYALQLGDGVKVSRITSLNKDIAYALAAADVRILAPIPGQQAIGIEVPNEDREVVALGDILTSKESKNATHPLELAVGRDIKGKTLMLNLATTPHLLIAGATGAGKSSCINAMVTSVLMRTTPDQVRLILIDPKRVEMGQYEGVPHLLTAPVTDPKKAANALHWAVREMERRYDILSNCGFRDIAGYNAAYDRDELPEMDFIEEGSREYERLPFIMVVVDELSDLMMVAARDVEDSICRLAQMARAVGIHLVVATQRPSVNVITGVIKANIPARLAFAVSSLADSRVILDQQGAERLVGKGDMLLLGPSSSTPQRIQGAWVEESEVREVVATWKAQFDSKEEHPVAQDLPDVLEPPVSSEPVIDITEDFSRPTSVASEQDDELYEEARKLVISSQLGSTSMLQRKLRVGFARAGRLMDLLEESGVVGPSSGSKAREVLIVAEEFEIPNEEDF
ncbi:MAG: DNA translocase FtsK 4TM domain-containing protein [Acidimicrobiales bacterium]|jgi:S-DNA-T family DNA segregation ATPase FtsK/SpoIIIE|nr:DNA translocase FtsK 4TM domain-containing protein [Acidimicrobiales bacterium]MDP6895110.1 DNA translocase FtsK 4TM domain-containing protein [Acidimicrobiales bacterium]